MKNLREEIEKILYEPIEARMPTELTESAMEAAFKRTKEDLYEMVTKKIINLFRSWALGCVGEDADIEFNQGQLKKHGYSEDMQVRAELRDIGYNQAKAEIRERIEEVMK